MLLLGFAGIGFAAYRRGRTLHHGWKLAETQPHALALLDPMVTVADAVAQASRPGAARTARSFDPPSCQDIAEPCLACFAIRRVALPDVRSATEELIDRRSMIRSARDTIHEI